MKHAEDAGDGWLIFKESIYAWWTRKGGLADSEFGRLFHLRTDVVKRSRIKAWPSVRIPIRAVQCEAKGRVTATS